MATNPKIIEGDTWLAPIQGGNNGGRFNVNTIHEGVDRENVEAILKLVETMVTHATQKGFSDAERWTIISDMYTARKKIEDSKKKYEEVRKIAVQDYGYPPTS
ncbi:hypothetical protein EYR38_010423 [Pleurotus pulmonarius]|nr:hypothetical protein EYR38_010423 [Pleurotus pulmonarius]